MGLLKKRTTKKKAEEVKVEDIVAVTETDGGVSEETELVEEIELVEDGDLDDENND